MYSSVEMTAGDSMAVLEARAQQMAAEEELAQKQGKASTSAATPAHVRRDLIDYATIMCGRLSRRQSNKTSRLYEVTPPQTHARAL